jgi:hypothetical protein
MAISFFPLGVQFSSSFAINGSFTVATSVDGFPQSASLAEYVSNYTGPTGPTYETVTLLRYVS